MKVCKIKLQEDGPELFRVLSYSNTTLLHVGMSVPREKVAEWCTMKRVDIAVVGSVEDEQDTLELPPVTAKDVQRVDALQLAAQTMQDTGPGHNPF